MRGERFAPDHTINTVGLTGCHVNVWGFVGFGFGARVFVADDHFNSAGYLKCLKDNFLTVGFDSKRIVFMQDNVKFYKTDQIMEFFRSNHISVLNHPPQSPDLNIQENIWSLINRQLKEYLRTHFINRSADLFEKVREFAEAIPIPTVNQLIESMPARVNEVSQNLGGQTHY